MAGTTGHELEALEVQEYYANLLILQYRNKPKARDTIKIAANLFLSDGLVFQLEDLLDIDKAKGAWLDLIGKLVGAPRNVQNVGVLDDPDYRVLIKFKVLYNVMRTSNKDMDEALYSLFQQEVLLSNNQDLTITYIVDDDLETPLEAALNLGYLTSPIGIGNGYIIVPDPFKLFGFDTQRITGKAVGFSTKDE